MNSFLYLKMKISTLLMWAIKEFRKISGFIRDISLYKRKYNTKKGKCRNTFCRFRHLYCYLQYVLLILFEQKYDCDSGNRIANEYKKYCVQSAFSNTTVYHILANVAHTHQKEERALKTSQKLTQVDFIVAKLCFCVWTLRIE